MDTKWAKKVFSSEMHSLTWQEKIHFDFVVDEQKSSFSNTRLDQVLVLGF